MFTISALPTGVTYEKNQLTVAAGFQSALPIVLEFSDSQSSLTVKIGAGAQVIIMEVLSGSSDISHTTHIELGDESSCECISLQTIDPTKTFLLTQTSAIGAGAKLQWRNITLGAKLVEQNVRSEIVGINGRSDIDWVFFAQDSEKYDLSARNVFLAREGSGEIIMKGIAEETGHAVAKGLIEIGPVAGATNTYLTQEVLMLDPTAKVDAVPGLEIKTNDVKASHSASVARVTPEDLFYFAARGIPEGEARHMYVRGFLGDLVQKITDETLRERVLEQLERKYAR